MSKSFLFFSLIILWSARICYSQDSTYTREVISKLTSEQLHGRGYVRKGDKKAARFLAREFRKIGLQTSGEKGFYQPFEFPVNRFPGRMDVTINGNKLQPGIDFLIDPSSMRTKGRYTLTRYEDLDKNETATPAGLRWILADTLAREKEDAEAALKKLRSSEAGIILVQDKKLTWGVSTICKGAPVILIRREALPQNPKTIEVCIDQHHEPAHRAFNVIGKMEGMIKDTFLVVTAHYDHLGCMGRKTFFPGANDNASGVSMLLNLARHFKSLEYPPKYSMIFIAFAGEEAGLKGSKHYTEHPVQPLNRIRFLINLDLLGTGEEGVMVVNATEFPSEFRMLDSLNRGNQLLTEIRQRGKAANSDHYWFSEKGVPAFFLYTLGGITAYHDVYDRAETLPLSRYKGVFELLIRFVEAL